MNAENALIAVVVLIVSAWGLITAIYLLWPRKKKEGL